jgi:hypothetical protein
MFFGTGLPLLFPIALFSLIIIEVCDKFDIAYTHIRPPAMDDTLSTNCINMLKLSPVLMAMNSFWMVTNKQMFDNDYEFINF